MTGAAFFDINACMFTLIKKIFSPNNNRIELYFNGVQTGKRILIIGGFHGNEPQAPEILNEYIKTDLPAKNQLYIIPCLNPDGLNAKNRVNSNGVDLNRNFPANNWEKTERNDFFGGEEPASELETRFMCEVLSDIKPDLILSIHAPFKVVNYDGPAYVYAEKIAQIMNYPVQGDIGYPTPGSFGTYCGVERNIPAVTLELGEDEDSEAQKACCFNVFDWLASLD